MDSTPVKSYTRWIMLLAGVAIQLCLGTAYIWGVFQVEVIKPEILNWPQQNAALTFSLLLGVLTFGSTIGGLLQNKLNPRPVLIIGGIILAIGFFFASFATKEIPWLMWIMYGILGGFGMGMTYTTTIAVCQKWFPDHRGLITGIIVSALGVGGLVFTPVANALIKGVGVMDTFKWFALIFLVVTVVCGVIIKNPPKGYMPTGWTPPVRKDTAPHIQDFSPKETLRTPQFYIVTASLMLASAAGLMVIPFAKVLGLDGGLTAEVATVGVMVISIFNAFGRFFWGWVSDKLGRKRTLIILMLLAAVSIPFAAFAQSYLVLVLIAVVGFSYGGFLGVFPALTADYFGVKSVSAIYGMVLLGFGIGAVASSYVAGYFKQISGGFLVPFLVAAGAALLGALLMALLKHPKLKKEAETI